jgi:hydrogenase expression/formation protein HypC
MCLAIPGKVVRIDQNESPLLTGMVNFGGVSREVVLEFVPQVSVGEYVIVHSGFALSIVDHNEAKRIFEMLETDI